MTGQICDPTTSSTPFACTITATYLGTEHIPPDWDTRYPTDYVFDKWRFQASGIDGWRVHLWHWERDVTVINYLTSETTYRTDVGTYDSSTAQADAITRYDTACHSKRYSPGTSSAPELSVEEITTAWRVWLELELDKTHKLVYPSGGVKLAYDVASGKLLAHY